MLDRHSVLAQLSNAVNGKTIFFFAKIKSTRTSIIKNILNKITEKEKYIVAELDVHGWLRATVGHHERSFRTSGPPLFCRGYTASSIQLHIYDASSLPQSPWLTLARNLDWTPPQEIHACSQLLSGFISWIHDLGPVFPSFPRASFLKPLLVLVASSKLADVGSFAHDRVSGADCDRAFEPGAEVARRTALPLRVVDVTEQVSVVEAVFVVVLDVGTLLARNQRGELEYQRRLWRWCSDGCHQSWGVHLISPRVVSW